MSIKVYKGDYEGLIRAEVEFRNENDAKCFKPLNWFADEITYSPIGRDKSLILLTKKEFLLELKKYY